MNDENKKGIQLGIIDLQEEANEIRDYLKKLNGPNKERWERILTGVEFSISILHERLHYK